MLMRRAGIILALCAPLLALGSAGVGQGHASTATPTTIHVPGDAPTIQAGINQAADGDSVVVSPGRYRENIDFHGKAITLRSAQGPGHTTIDGSRLGTVVTFASGEPTSSVLEGFTVQYGRASFSGGGIRIVGASPTILGNVITLNAAAAQGGGIAVEGGSPLIARNTIVKNAQKGGFGGNGGGGMVVATGSAAHILDNVISGNTWNWATGGIALVNVGAVLLQDNVISHNVAVGGGDGGGIVSTNGSDASIVGNLITDNQASSGGGVWISPSAGSLGPMLLNNTIAGNSPGAAYLGGFDQNARLLGNIISASAAPAVVCDSTYQKVVPALRADDIFATGSPALQGCGAPIGTEMNISADPLFVSPSGGDYHLSPASPSIDAGDGGAAGLPTADLDGNPRLEGKAVDQGAYEFSDAPPGAVTGLAVTRGKSSATVAWSAPQMSGGGPITSYRVTVSPGGASQSIASTKSSAKFNKLGKGVGYTFTVVAINQFGTGPPANISG